ncbi:hypothetical protein MUP77_16060 [Candidatus Bathyarchaeota archaeon]|nr:hypothetical protein [Candidatus Bathyarchaeota archaeon]
MQFPIQHVATLTAVRATEPTEAQRELTGETVGKSEGVSRSESEPHQASLHDNIRTASLSKQMKPAICREIQMGMRTGEVLRGNRGQHASKGLSRNLRGPAKWSLEFKHSKGMHNFAKCLRKGVGDAHSSKEVSNNHGAKGHYLNYANIETRRTD